MSLNRAVVILAALGGLVASSGAQLISNGSFEVEPAGTVRVIGSSGAADSSTFTEWRVFSVGSPAISSFSATAVTNASSGNSAIRLDMDNTGGAANDHGFDRNNAKIPVTYGTDYILAFDAAWISGSTNLWLTLAEYDASGAFLGKQTSYSIPVSSSEYQPFVFEWTPISTESVFMNIAFRPKSSGGETSASLLLDNVRFTSNLLAWSAGGLYTSAPSFSQSDHVVSTSVFHWYTSTTGQESGPWRPLEGRSAWTGDPDWWQGQIKQMMMANIDILHVHLYPGHEQQRINLFQALNQLRYEGYDVPKIAPFLDPVITWNGQPLVDVGTAAGKDEFANQYIRFFNQYYSVNQDAYADDYLARFNNRVVLDSWYLSGNLTNIVSLTNLDLTSRLAEALETFHPVFSNNIYMITLVAGTTFGFADEKIVQFENNDYFHPFVYNGIKTVQLKAGYWDQNVRTPGSFVARDGGIHFSAAWDRVDETIDHAYVESWNEYDEGSGIYAANPGLPYIKPGSSNTNSDSWSSSNDPYEYIRTTANGAAAFNDVPERDARILWHNFPTHMVAGGTQAVTVVVRNEGDASWTAGENYKFGEYEQMDPVLFGPSRYLIDDSADEIPVYGGIFRRRPKTFNLVLTAPSTPGTYDTHWGMLKEGVAWFGEQIAHTFTVTQTVYQAWAAEYFTLPEQTNALISGEMADPDGDTFTNWDEYIAGTDPADAQSVFEFIVQPGFSSSNGYVVEWPAVSGRVYVVSWTTNLLNAFIPLQTNITWPQSSYTDQIHGVQADGFYRMEVNIP